MCVSVSVRQVIERRRKEERERLNFNPNSVGWSFPPGWLGKALSVSRLNSETCLR